MRVYIPSMGRAGNIGSISTTANSVKVATYVVPPDEVERYRRSLSRMHGGANGYEVIGCAEKGIAATRHWIGKLAADRDQKTFCMMDDDLYFSERIETCDWHLRQCTTDDVSNMIEWIAKSLKKYAHVSVSPRMVNAAQFKDGCGPDDGVQENKRTLRLLAYRTKEFLQMKHGRVPVMEDFDVNLQLLEAGHKNLLSYYWANDQRGTGSKGGCSSYRTLEAHNAAAHTLCTLHPKFVKLKEKETASSSKELRVRMEVTIQWQKAWESSQ